MIATDKSLSHHIEIIEKVLDCFEKANIKIKAKSFTTWVGYSRKY